MLKRLSEEISQSNIESNSLASEICSQHSSCNFNAKQRIEQSAGSGNHPLSVSMSG
jgi:hypothetical protein